MRKCPTCGQLVPPFGISASAARTLEFMKKECPGRGGYMFEGARLAYEAGTYRDAEITELLSHGLIAPHPDPTKGWVVVEPTSSSEGEA